MTSYLFVITKEEKEIKKEVHAFISLSFNDAILYFRHWIENEREKEKYKLRQIGSFKEGKLITCNILISAGYEEPKNYKQLKIEYELNKFKKGKDLIKALFKGEEIK